MRGDLNNAHELWRAVFDNLDNLALWPVIFLFSEGLRA